MQRPPLDTPTVDTPNLPIVITNAPGCAFYYLIAQFAPVKCRKLTSISQLFHRDVANINTRDARV